MKISELFPDVVTEDTEYEFKALLKQDNPVKWAKTIVGYANDQGGIIFVGVSNDGEAFGLDCAGNKSAACGIGCQISRR